MAYYSGTANSFGDLRTALFNACVANGWTLSGEILSKGDAYVKATVSTTETTTLGPGIVLQGGTGIDAGVLVNPSAVTPRMGKQHLTLGTQPSWPMSYAVHVFENPDEVYLVARFNSYYFYWLAFGVSDVPGVGENGLWIGATSRAGGISRTGMSGGVAISPAGGSSEISNISTYFSGYSSALFFYDRPSTSASNLQDTIRCALDSAIWAGPAATIAQPYSQGALSAVIYAAPHLARMPSTWNSESILLPIQPHVGRPSSKVSMVANLRNARYTRLDNYDPGQIIALGEEQWVVYPWYRKDSSARDGGSSIDHTGTLGWAIRYDGP